VDTQTLVMLSSIILIGDDKTRLMNLRLVHYCHNDTMITLCNNEQDNNTIGNSDRKAFERIAGADGFIVSSEFQVRRERRIKLKAKLMNWKRKGIRGRVWIAREIIRLWYLCSLW
jgi:hypothetical protein